MTTARTTRRRIKLLKQGEEGEREKGEQKRTTQEL